MYIFLFHFFACTENMFPKACPITTPLSLLSAEIYIMGLLLKYCQKFVSAYLDGAICTNNTTASINKIKKIK